MSDRSQSSEDDFDDDGCVRPYLYEPMADATVLPAESAGATTSLLSVNVSDLSSWCSCRNCTVMTTAAECVCCQSIGVIRAKCKEVVDSGIGPAPACIVDHPGFPSVCLNVWVLQAVYNEYKHRYGNLEKPLFDRYRYCAYRHLVRWCWGYIGQHHRVVLPACAVSAIRQQFPSDSYAGFHLPEMTDA